MKSVFLRLSAVACLLGFGATATAQVPYTYIDVQAVFAAVAGHRLKPASNSAYRTPAELSRHVLDSVAIP